MFLLRVQEQAEPFLALQKELRELTTQTALSSAWTLFVDYLLIPRSQSRLHMFSRLVPLSPYLPL